MGAGRASGADNVALGRQDLEQEPIKLLVFATASTAQYNGMLEAGGNLDWAYISAPALLGDGPRRGPYRSSTKALVTRLDGTSELSWSDFAIVVVDEIERPSGARRLTAAY
jgi:putative NADH-flavin reductase